VGHDRNYLEQTEIGVIRGEEISKTVRIPVEEAAKMVQQAVYKLDYSQAQAFAEKYKK
jgi:hypothetical protein